MRVAPRRNQVRNRLTAGGNRIRTIGPALVKGLSAVADERCRADKLDGVIKHRSSRETTMVGRLLRGDPRPTACRHSPRPINMGLVSLAETFGLPAERIRRDLFASRAINWGNDPFARGAYSDATPKTCEALAVLRRPAAMGYSFPARRCMPVGTWGLSRRRWPAVGRRRKQRPRLASNCRPIR